MDQIVLGLIFTMSPFAFRRNRQEF